MDDKYRIDSHKMSQHPTRVAQWLEAGTNWEKQKKIYPIYVEISPSGSCNHRCSFCAVDYIGYKNITLEESVLKRTLESMAANGVKSVMFAGEGEPLLMKGLADCIVFAKNLGLDIGITTNATPLSERFLETALSSIAWIKASVNAGEASSYGKIHGTRSEDFERVFANLARAVQFRNEHGLKTTLGAQAVLIPENLSTVRELCLRAKSIGLDYVVIKPYSQHEKSEATRERGYENFDYQSQLAMGEELKKLNEDTFQVVFRSNTMKILNEPERYYQKCQATPNFWAYVMASGDVYGCSAYLLDERFRYGNIKENSFSEIWEGEKRRQSAEFVREELNIEDCRKNCRMEHVNRYLWDITHPSSHDNFI
jgi:radical SAM protein with 4Fe4S-binding SPASM domain